MSKNAQIKTRILDSLFQTIDMENEIIDALLACKTIKDYCDLLARFDLEVVSSVVDKNFAIANINEYDIFNLLKATKNNSVFL